LHKRNKHFHSKKLHSRALRGVFWNENANLRKLTGWFDSTLADRFVVTADTGAEERERNCTLKAKSGAPILSLSGNWLSRWRLAGAFSSGNGGGMRGKLKMLNF
jgi:hypothetical protein